MLPPALRTLRLGQFFAQPLTVHTFSSCPLLHTLDMSAVEKQLVAFPIGALPASLTELHCPGVCVTPLKHSLPASLRRLHVAVNRRVEPGLLPAGLLILQLHCNLGGHPFFAGGLPSTVQELTLNVPVLTRAFEHASRLTRSCVGCG